MNISLSTLCYLERDGQYLMLYRNVKEQDINEGKWIGVGGHFLPGESPEACLLREVKEETGYTLTSWRFRGIVTFVSGEELTEYMHLFTADAFTGTQTPCTEGELHWIPKEQVLDLPIWEGDQIFLSLLEEESPFFSLRLSYDREGNLQESVLQEYNPTEKGL